MAQASDGRWFICQQTGQLRIVENGALVATPALSLTVDTDGERGLLGVALDPAFDTNHYIYVYYTVPGIPLHNRVSRFTMNGNIGDPTSQLILFDLDSLVANNHNGGAIHFGSDGKLYFAAGENNTPSNAQTLTNVLGKILRINSDGSIPADNPFYGTTTGSNRAIWAYGLRNPYTFAFHPQNGRMFINDVGQSAWEEVNDGIAGSNYGWPVTEGATNNPLYRSPLFTYGHSGSYVATGCAITGSTFNAGNQFPVSYANRYFFADYCNGWIRSLDPASPSTSTMFATGISFPVDVHMGIDGCLYYLSRGPDQGTLGKICYSAGHRNAAGAFLSSTSRVLLTQDSSRYLADAMGTLGSPPAVSHGDSDNTFVAARDNFHGTWLNFFDVTTQAWDTWQFAGGIVQGTPSIAVHAGVAYFSARDLGNAYWINSYTPGIGFGGWQNLGGVFSTDPAMAAAADGSIYLVGRDNSGGIWSGRYLEAGGFQGWHYGGAITQGKPAVAAGSDNAAYISIRDYGDHLWLGRVLHDSFTGWFYGDGQMSADSQIAAAGGSVYVMVIDSYGGSWYRPFTEGTSNGFQNWFFSGGKLKDVSIATGGSSVRFVGRDSQNGIWWYDLTQNRWSSVSVANAAPNAITGSR